VHTTASRCTAWWPASLDCCCTGRCRAAATRDGEVADSSYFFGFLLTLVVLTVGVYRIGVPLSGGGVAGGTEITSSAFSTTSLRASP
jgi:hypothetical protein